MLNLAVEKNNHWAMKG